MKKQIKFINLKNKKDSNKTDLKPTNLKNESYEYQIISDINNKGEKIKAICIIGLRMQGSNIVIPEKIDDISVTAIKENTFYGNKTIENVIIPQSVKKIGKNAFYNCINLKCVELPIDLDIIDESTFEGCSNLERVLMPYGVKEIRKNAFKNCSSLTQYWHYMKRGISAVMKVDKNCIENHFPSGLEYIQEGAFFGCSSIKEIYIPHGVKEISNSSFENCSGLEKVKMHNNIEVIKSNAFKGCSSLKGIIMPEHINEIDDEAFESDTKLYCLNEESVNNLKEKTSKDVVLLNDKKIEDVIGSSQMIPYENTEEYKAFYDKESFKVAQERYELRTLRDTKERQRENNISTKSRFSLKDGYYTNNNENTKDHAKIIMTGDLMCREEQIKSAGLNGEFNFDDSFKYVKDILNSSDLTIGNLETIISPSLPYSSEEGMIDDRIHLNAPEEYLTSVSKAGIDVIINAQNHMYDGGLCGIYETLESLNRHQLIHTGLFASKKDKRYILFNLNGIKVGVVAYADPARQKMKRLNFSDEASDTLFSFFEKEKIEKDIKDAKDAGAEFIIAYCHWGREYTKEITKRQEGFAKMVANAGADFLLGSHSHCLQPFSIIKTDDDRTVPVLYSAGNFLSNIDIKMPYVRDSLMLEMELERNLDGKVVIDKLGYYPCIIYDGAIKNNMIVSPISEIYKTADAKRQIQLDEDLVRIKQCIGNLPMLSCYTGGLEILGQDDNDSYNDEFDVSDYEICPPEIARSFDDNDEIENNFYFDEDENIYKQKSKTGKMEARLLLSGQLTYDVKYDIENSYYGKYEFLNSISQLNSIFTKSDFVISSTNAMISDEYPTIKKYRNLLAKPDNFVNAPKAFLSALNRCGCNLLVTSHPNNLGTGVRGLFKTEKNIIENNMISSGIGKNKNPIIEINDIKIAVLSFATTIREKANIITDEGAQLFLNEYSVENFKKAFKEVKEKGAEFVIAYINCGEGKSAMKLSSRQRVADEVAELGADYVVCVRPNVLSKYYVHKTKDGRDVAVASSLGTMLTGKFKEDKKYSALINLVVRKDFDGNISFEDNYIPTKIDNNEACGSRVVVMHDLYGKKENVKSYSDDIKKVETLIGNEIAHNSERIVKIDSYNRYQMTIKEIYELLDAKPSKSDLSKFKDSYNKPIKLIASRKNDLRKGCVAVYVNQHSYNKAKVQMTMKDILANKCVLVIAKKHYSEIPTIVVENPQKAYEKIAKYIRDKYNPLTIAVTGTAGKTTTKDLLSSVFDTTYNTLHIEGNNNTITTSGMAVQKLSDDYEAYIQEVHGGTIGSAKAVSNLIEPNICIITNIGPGHLGQMKTMENVIQGKMDIISGLQEGGKLVINNDNEYLKEQHPNVTTIRYSSYDKDMDYYAQNIKDCGNRLEFQIVSKGGKFDEPGVYDAVLNFQGLHNVNNAVGVFAVARQAGIPANKIIAGLARYTPAGDRQNLTDNGGYKLLVDVYSCTTLSMISGIETLAGLDIQKGGRRIAIAGDITDQGDKSMENHFITAEQIANLDFDILLSAGEDAKYLAQRVRELGRKAYFFRDRKTFNAFIANYVRPNDILLFKASSRVKFKEHTLNYIFGRIDE